VDVVALECPDDEDAKRQPKQLWTAFRVALEVFAGHSFIFFSVEPVSIKFAARSGFDLRSKPIEIP
jgi:hypothetical protein